MDWRRLEYRYRKYYLVLTCQLFSYMKLHYLQLILLSFSFTFLFSCQKEESSIMNSSADVFQSSSGSYSVQDQELENVLTQASDGAGLSFFQLPDSDDFANIPQDPKNPITKEKVELGKLLYHETGIALHPTKDISQGNYSCASCHFASAGFQAGRFQGIAEGGIGFGINGEGRVKGALYKGEELDVQPIRSPTALNVAYQKLMLWNGQFGATSLNENTGYAWTEDTPIANNNLGYEGVETQAIAGLTVHRMGIELPFMNSNNYTAYYKAAYPDLTTEASCNLEYSGLAIAAYERTLLANQSPFQRWLKGEVAAMSDLQKEGAILFFGKAKCNNCHTGPALNKMEFHALGMKDLYQIGETTFKTASDNTENFGRGGFTGKEEDMYRFKTPQLYNLADSPFYGHGSSFRSIREVIAYKNEGVKENEQIPDEALSPHFQPLGLSDAEITALTAFIEEGLKDPDLKRYEPASLPTGSCFPFNDPMARNHLGCN